MGKKSWKRDADPKNARKRKNAIKRKDQKQKFSKRDFENLMYENEQGEELERYTQESKENI